MSDLWRIKIGIQNGNASWGKWDYYETRDDMERNLLLLVINYAENTDRGRSNYQVRARRRWGFKAWRILSGTETPYSDNRIVSNIFAVDHMENDEWVSYNWNLEPPVLTMVRAHTGGEQ